jgi:hypothetical protein
MTNAPNLLVKGLICIKWSMRDENTHFPFINLDMSREYIYEPWTAPLSIQKKAKCIIGKDYPKPGKRNNYLSKTSATTVRNN